MVSNHRKARRNTVARAAATGQRPAAAYRQLRAENTPFEGYAVDLYHVPDAFTDEQAGHRADFYGYRVTAPDGRLLSKWEAAWDTEVLETLAGRHQYALRGRALPLDAAALRARFPGTRLTEHTTMPEVCHGCQLTRCWEVHHGCAPQCEWLQARRVAEAKIEAEETYETQVAAWRAEGEALDAQYARNAAVMEAEDDDWRRRFEAHRERLAAGRPDPAGGGILALSDEQLRLSDRHRALFEQHRRAHDAWSARVPARPAHWTARGEPAAGHHPGLSS